MKNTSHFLEIAMDQRKDFMNHDVSPTCPSHPKNQWSRNNRVLYIPGGAGFLPSTVVRR